VDVWPPLLRVDVFRVLLPVLRSYPSFSRLKSQLGFFRFDFFFYASPCNKSSNRRILPSIHVRCVWYLSSWRLSESFCLVFDGSPTHFIDFLLKLHYLDCRMAFFCWTLQTEDFHLFTSKMPRLYFEMLHESDARHMFFDWMLLCFTREAGHVE